MRDASLDNIVRSGLCSGCGACVYAATKGNVEMRMNAEGFLRPETSKPLAELDQRRVAAVCPGIHLSHPQDMEEGTRYNPIWGPVRGVWIGHAVDPRTRFEGSSGGVISAILAYLLQSGEVDFVVHTRSSSTDPLDNVVVASHSIDEVVSGAGSRYAPSAPVSFLREALSREGRFAFVGKPCDVGAMRKILNLEPQLVDRIPYLLSFMCAGTPSRLGTEEIIDQFGFKGVPLRQFRYRGQGWPGMTSAETADGRSGQMDYNTAWGKILNRHLQPRCKICADGTGEFADLIGADAWYGENGYPDFSEHEGRSLVMARNAKGQALLERAVAARFIFLESFTVEGLPTIQPYQLKRKCSLRARLLAMRLAGRHVPRYKGMGLGLAAKSAGLKENLKGFVGALRRAIQGRM